MAEDTKVSEIINQAIKKSAQENPNSYSLETLALLINADRLKYLENKVLNEFVELKKRQDKVTFLHKLIKTINTATNQKGEFDCSDNADMKALLEKAKDYGVELKDGKFKYTKDEKERLIENVRMTIDDYNVLNDMQLQTITRLTNERYESYQMARSIMKPLHDDKINKARAIAGR